VVVYLVQMKAVLMAVQLVKLKVEKLEKRKVEQMAVNLEVELELQ